DHVHIYVSGRTSRLQDGSLAGQGGMRAQLRLTCENVGKALEAVGATFAEVVRTNTYATDLDEYFRCSDERADFFKEPLPTSTAVQVSRLAMPGMLIEIEVEAIIEPGRLRVQG
ncbi:MAG: Rid family hydrolase, partial [Nitrospinota bacterium]